jgi:aminoglycoside phosphotransferase (APT) family kinase protein
MIDALAGGPVPTLLGHDGCRMLMAAVPGDDMYEAALPQLLDMVTTLVGIQAAWIGRVEELLATGLPDWRATAMAAAVADVVRRTGDELASAETALLGRFIDDLPRRFSHIEACGIPDTLVHGDFHAGNVRGTARSLTLLDWGDSGVGHPLLDQSAFLDRIPAEHVGMVSAHWIAAWRTAMPGSDPARAAALLGPVAAARQAVIYRRFLDNIEPSEQVYHRHDPADWLRRTAALVAEGRQ